jgi:hypothetical protein
MERFPFKTVGGYAIIPDANGDSSFHGKREDLDTFLLDAEVLGNGLELRTPSQLTSIERSLRRRGVDRVVILTKSLNAGYVAAVMVALTGVRPTIDHRVMVWSDLRHHQFRPIDAQAVGAISSCALEHRQSAAVAASCVERELGLS